MSSPRLLKYCQGDVWCTMCGKVLNFIGPRFLGQVLIQRANFIQVFRTEVLKVQQCIVRTLRGADHFVEFQLNGCTITVLRMLHQKHHEKRDDCCSGIDDELPCIAKMKNRAGQGPEQDYPKSEGKRFCTAQGSRGIHCPSGEYPCILFSHS